MTVALPAAGIPQKHKLDLSWPILILFAAVLCVLIILPMSWLVYYSLVDRSGAFTLGNFRTLVTDDAFVDPLLTTLILATSSSVICCIVAAPMGWLVARTDMPLRRTVRALVTASFVTPPFLGAIAWELLAAPNSGLLNKVYRAVTGVPQDEHLFDIYSLAGLIFVISCYTFPYVFVLLANALDRIPGDLEDASSILGGRTWTTARRITIPLALPALLAGALVAFLQAMTLFGSPAILAIPAGFHTMTTKIWSLFNYPPKPELAAAASLPLLVLTVLLLRGEHLILGRRGYSVVGGKQGDPRLIRLGWLNWIALAFVLFVLLCPVFLPYGALLNATFSRVATSFVWFDNFTLHNIYFVFFELSATKLAVQNTFLLGVSSATMHPRSSARPHDRLQPTLKKNASTGTRSPVESTAASTRPFPPRIERIGSSLMLTFSPKSFWPTRPVKQLRFSLTARPPKSKTRKPRRSRTAAGSRITVYFPGGTSRGSRLSRALRAARSASRSVSSSLHLGEVFFAQPELDSPSMVTENSAIVSSWIARTPRELKMAEPAMPLEKTPAAVNPSFSARSITLRIVSARSSGLSSRVSSSRRSTER